MGKLRKTKKVLDKEYEELGAVGTEGKKGVKYAKEYFAEKEKDIKLEAEVEAELLASKKKKFAYTSFLAGLLLKRLEDIEWPEGWVYQVAPTDIGVVMEIKTKEGKLFRTAFKAVGEGYWDLNAVNNFAERCWNLIDKQEDKNGIITL